MANPTRALILSGRAGGKGEDGVADGCISILEPLGVQCKVLDLMAMLGPRRGRAFSRIFQYMYFHPNIFDAYYYSQLRVDDPFSMRTNKLLVDHLEVALRKEIEDFAPDVVFSVFPSATASAARLRSRGMSFRHVVVSGDAFILRWYVQDHTDLFLVTSALAAESVRRFRPEARVEVIVLPAAGEYWTAPSREEARESLGVPLDATCVLVMASALGLGPLDLAARELAEDNVWVLVVGGTNERLVKRLRSLSRSHPNVVPFGFTDRLPELMACSDLVAGCASNSCHLARIVGRSLILLDVLPGMGRDNLIHQLELGSAIVTSLAPSVFPRAVRAFLADPERSCPPPRLERGVAERQFLDALRSVGVAL